MSDKLKSCPFCGGEVELEQSEGVMNKWNKFTKDTIKIFLDAHKNKKEIICKISNYKDYPETLDIAKVRYNCDWSLLEIGCSGYGMVSVMKEQEHLICFEFLSRFIKYFMVIEDNCEVV